MDFYRLNLNLDLVKIHDTESQNFVIRFFGVVGINIKRIKLVTLDGV